MVLGIMAILLSYILLIPTNVFDQFIESKSAILKDYLEFYLCGLIVNDTKDQGSYV